VLGGLTPARVFLGRESPNPLSVIVTPKQPPTFIDTSTSSFLRNFNDLQRARDANVKHVMSVRHQPRTRPAQKSVDIKIHDYVLASQQVIAPHARVDKTQPRWYGPYQVVDCINPLVFVIKDIVTNVEREVHAAHLMRFAGSDLPMSDELFHTAAHGTRGYLPRRILAHNINSKGLPELLVSWEPEGDVTWEPYHRFNRDASRVVTAYLRLLSAKARALLLARVKATA
jgi:hypothetical protein